MHVLKIFSFQRKSGVSHSKIQIQIQIQRLQRRDRVTGSSPFLCPLRGFDTFDCQKESGCYNFYCINSDIFIAQS